MAIIFHNKDLRVIYILLTYLFIYSIKKGIIFGIANIGMN